MDPKSSKYNPSLLTGQSPIWQAGISKKLRSAHAILNPAKPTAARFDHTLLIRTKMKYNATHIKWKYPGFPNEVPVVFNPVIVMFLLSIVIHGRKQETTRPAIAINGRSFVNRMNQMFFYLPVKCKGSYLLNMANSHGGNTRL